MLSWFTNLKTGTKLLSAFTTIGAFMVIISWMAIGSLGTINEGAKLIYEENLIPIKLLAEMRGRTHLVRALVIQHIAAPTTEEKAEIIRSIQQTEGEIEERRVKFEPLISSVAEKENYAKYRTAWKEYQRLRDEQTLKLSTEGKEKQAYEVMKHGVGQKYTEIVGHLTSVIDDNERQAKHNFAQGQRLYATARATMLGTATVGILLGLLAGWLISRQLVRSLHNIIEAAAKATVGDLTARSSLTTTEETGQLGQAFNHMVEALEHAAEKQKAALAAQAAHISGVTTAIDKVLGSIEFALDGTVLTANDNYLQLMGYRLEEIQGRHHRMFCEPDYAASQAYTDFWAKLNRGQFDVDEYKQIDTDGRLVWIQASYNPIFDADGTPYKIVEFATDITARKQAKFKLQQAAQELASQNIKLTEAHQAALAATRAKSEFLSTMSHEIRTPMNAILGMADLLQETSLSQDQQEYVNRFTRATNSLLVLINNILDLSKIESGHMELEATPFDLHDLTEKTVELMAIRANAKRLELMAYVHPDIPAWVIGDPTRLRQVLANMMGNAVKFTEIGEVTLRIEPAHGDPGAIRFSVSDTGIGIPEEKLRTIFDSFTQGDSSTTRKYGGTGLGLTISKQLVELMGGTLHVESTPSLGSTFSFVVRLATATAVKTGPPLRLAIEGRRILVVDDNDTNCLIVRENLTRFGAVIVEASDGPAALAALDEARQRGEPFHLAILDYLMPGMNGLELAQAMRAREDISSLPIVLYTSEMGGDFAQQARALGIANYAYKPISRTRLLTSVAVALGQALAPEPKKLDHAGLDPSSLPSLHILLVEDIEDNRDVVALFLKGTRCKLDMAENGSIAVQKFQAGTYDLVFMDMQMPVMDGLRATMTIRQWEREQQREPTPIVFLTANAFQEDIDKSLAAGCTAHLTKPIKKKTLMAAIAEHGYRKPLAA